MHYFSEISGIPHGSGNTGRLEQYCMDFAAEHGLCSYQDDYGNVMIFKEASSGYENSDPVILQGHLDMVCEAEPDCPLDMAQDAIRLCTDGEYLWADKTTLGADDGIAIAYILALLASKDAKHPPLEALFTCDEEIGLCGAHALDVSKLKGRHLINIDSEKEGYLTVSCAGAVRISCEIPLSVSAAKGRAGIVRISGLRGGHSGMDIGKNRVNAVKALARLLDVLNEKAGIYIASVHAGGKLNVIPKTAEAVICAEESKWACISDEIEGFSELLKKECAVIEPDVAVHTEDTSLPVLCTDEAGTRNLIFALMQAPSGVYAMNPKIGDQVQTSLNLGSAEQKEDKLEMAFMVRSNTDSGKQILVRQISLLAQHLKGKVRLEGDYPAWEYRPESVLRERMVQAFNDIYNEAPKICAIHAGLECGILAKKLPDVDMVSFGPTLENVHTPLERMEVKSAKRCWKYLLHVLELLK